MEIKKATKEDANQLIELMQKADNRAVEWAEERVKRFVLKNNNKMILIAKDNGLLIGYIGLKKYGDNDAREFINLNEFAWITWVAVLPEYRNKKIGKKLLESAEKYFRAYGKKGLVLDCRQKVIDFYKKNGYIVIGNYLDNETPRYVMAKEVN